MKKIIAILVVLTILFAYIFWNIFFDAGEDISFKTNGSSKTVSMKPDFFLDGDGTNIDSPEFFEANDASEVFLFVSAKGNDLVEVWKFPFENNQFSVLKIDSMPNGLDIDQEKKMLLIGDADKRNVEIRSLPDLALVSTIGEGIVGAGETNLDVLTLPDGTKHIYVSENRKLNIFDLESGNFINSFSPNVESIEEVLADNFHQIIYVPEENGAKSKIHAGGAIAAYHPGGEIYLKNNSNIFGQGLFTGDEEGIALYACKGSDRKDNGKGFIVVANQAPASLNKFEFFDRMTWQHLGSLILEGVSGTDGIAVTELPLPNFPQGILAVSNADRNIALISWEKIAQALDLRCEN